MKGCAIGRFAFGEYEEEEILDADSADYTDLRKTKKCLATNERELTRINKREEEFRRQKKR